MTMVMRLGLATLVGALVTVHATPGGAAEEAAVMAPTKRVDLNTATPAELAGLPGVGRKRAEAIIAKRPFKRVTELLRIKGFGPKLFARLRDHVTVGGPPTAPTTKERLEGLGRP